MSERPVIPVIREHIARARVLSYQADTRTYGEPMTARHWRQIAGKLRRACLLLARAQRLAKTKTKEESKP